MMMTRDMKTVLEDGSPEFEVLEALVDRAGLRNVVYALACIARAKAEHIRTNWQDDLLAKLWDRNAGTLERVKLVK